LEPIKIVTLDDERIHIPFHIPNGRGRPLLLKIPRLDFLTEDQFDGMSEALETLNGDAKLSERKKGRAVALAMLRQVTTDPQYAALEKLATGQLDQLLNEWTKRSAVSLGESGSSDESSMSTAEPSTATSLTVAGAEPTSDTA